MCLSLSVFTLTFIRRSLSLDAPTSISQWSSTAPKRWWRSVTSLLQLNSQTTCTTLRCCCIYASTLRLSVCCSTFVSRWVACRIPCLLKVLCLVKIIILLVQLVLLVALKGKCEPIIMKTLKYNSLIFPHWCFCFCRYLYISNTAMKCTCTSLSLAAHTYQFSGEYLTLCVCVRVCLCVCVFVRRL